MTETKQPSELAMEKEYYFDSLFGDKRSKKGRKGKFIIIDGMDGAGKTTSLEILKRKHEELGIPVKEVNVWSATRFGTAARKEVTDASQTLNPEAATLMAIAAVLHCYHSVVIPLLNEGYNVLLDRGPRSSYALQVADELEAGNDTPLSLWRIGFSNVVPDHEIVMLCDAETALKRCVERSGELDGIEARGVEYHQSRAEIYSQSFPGKPDLIVIRNEGSLESLEQSLEYVMRLIASNEAN